MKKKAFINALSALTVISLLLSACGGDASTTGNGTTTAEVTDENGSETEDTGETGGTGETGDDLGWPEEKITLTYWVSMSGNAAVAMTTLDEHPVYLAMEELTNIAIQFEHPADANTDFNLLIADAADTYPDIIEHTWSNYQGGPQAAINDGVIIALNELLDTVAPDAKAAFEATEIIDRHTKTDEGNVYAFQPVLNPDWDVPNANHKDLVQYGPIARKDWLDELGLNLPETIEDWTVALSAFRDEFGASAPFSTPGFNKPAFQAFAGVYGTTTDFYQREGEVIYGPMDDSYKDFLKQMRDWYADGLLDPDFSSNDGNAVTNNVLNEETGLFLQYTSHIATNMNAMANENPDFELIGTSYPDQLDGSEPQFMLANPGGVRPSGQAAITTNNDYPEYTAMYFNYFYTDEGALLKNFGVEGENWTYGDDGSIVLADRIENNPDGYSRQQALGVFTRGDVPTPGYLLKVIEPLTDDPAVANVHATRDTWSLEDTNPDDVLLPVGLTQTESEAAEISQYSTNINDYFETSMLQFIMGTLDIDAEWDNYISQLQNLGIEQVLAHRQAALDRYLER